MFTARSFLAIQFVIFSYVPTNTQSSSYNIQMLCLDTIHLVKVGVTQFPKGNSALMSRIVL